jgi:hypothetical protein
LGLVGCPAMLIAGSPGLLRERVVLGRKSVRVLESRYPGLLASQCRKPVKDVHATAAAHLPGARLQLRRHDAI